MKNGLRGFIVKQYPLLVVVSILITLISIFTFSNITKPLTLVPGTVSHNDSIYEAATYSDITDPGGSSSITPLQQSNKTLKYIYTIRKGAEYPYAGLSLFANVDGNSKIKNYIDLSKYTDIKLDIKAKNSKTEQLFIKTIIPKFTKKYNKGTRGNYVVDIPLRNGSFSGTIPLSSLITPDWWYKNNSITKSELPAEDFSKVIEIVFQNSVPGKEVAVTINEISFVKDHKAQVLTTVLILILFLILISSIRFIKLPTAPSEDDEKSEKIIISYDRVEIEDEQNNDLQRITDFIASNYANPDFSVEQLAKGAGVSTSRIPTLLKKHYSMNFKQYLNTVRITEAKRLLLETEHQIVTIAHSVGYNNIPHFNRTFKQVTGLSPKKYRENPEEAIDNLPGTVATKE